VPRVHRAARPRPRIMLSLVLARPEGKHDRVGRAALREPFGRQAGVDERVQQAGQRPVRGADLVAYPWSVQDALVQWLSR